MKKASVALPLRQLSVLRVFFGNPAGVRPVTENLLYAARREKMELWLVKREGDSLFDREISLPEGTRLFQPQAADLQQLWQQLTAEMSARRALLEEFCREKDLPPERIDALEDTFAFLQEHTTPVLLFLESAADFCQAADTISRLVFDKVIRGASVRSVYIMACYEPREQPVQGNLLYSVLIYTYGIRKMKTGGEREKLNLRQLLNVGVISCIIAVTLYISNLQVPALLEDTANRLGAITGPLSMLVIGDSLAQIRLKELFTDVRLLIFSALKLLLVPALLLWVLGFFITDPMFCGVCLVMTATPVGSMTVMLAQQYGGDYRLTSKGVALTTILSVATMPFLFWLLKI